MKYAAQMDFKSAIIRGIIFWNIGASFAGFELEFGYHGSWPCNDELKMKFRIQVAEYCFRSCSV